MGENNMNKTKNRKYFIKAGISIVLILVFVMPGSAILNENNISDGKYISVKYAKDLIENQKAIILDIQEEYQYNSYSINGVIAFSLSDMGCGSCLEYKLNRYESIIITSRDQILQTKAYNLLKDRGYNVYELVDSIINTDVARKKDSISDEEIINLISQHLEESPVFLLFYAEWCAYSQKEILILDSLQNLKEYNQIKFVYIDAEKHPKIANDFGIDRFPTMFLIDGISENGYEIMEQFNGFVNEDELRFTLDKFLGVNVKHENLEFKSKSSSCVSDSIDGENRPIPVSSGARYSLVANEIDKVISIYELTTATQVQQNPPNPGCCVNEPTVSPTIKIGFNIIIDIFNDLQYTQGNNQVQIITPGQSQGQSQNNQMTDEECCNAIRANCSNGDWGGVICCQGRMVSCVWHHPPFFPPSDPNGTTGRDYGHQLAEECVKVHEDDHHDSVTCAHTPSGQICRPPFLPGIDPPAEECHAYTMEIDCLNSKYQSCISQFPAGSADRAACIAYVTQIRTDACNRATQYCGSTPPGCNVTVPT